MKDIGDFVFKNIQYSAICLAKIEKTTLLDLRRFLMNGLSNDLELQPLNHNVRSTLIGIGNFLLYSHGRFASELIPLLTTALGVLPQMKWVDDGLMNKTDRIPIQEQFAFCFNTVLSDLAARLPEHRDAIVSAQFQIDALACAVASVIEILDDLENVGHSKSHLLKLTCYILGLLRSLGRYSPSSSRPLISYVFPVDFEFSSKRIATADRNGLEAPRISFNDEWTRIDGGVVQDTDKDGIDLHRLVKLYNKHGSSYLCNYSKVESEIRFTMTTKELESIFDTVRCSAKTVSR